MLVRSTILFILFSIQLLLAAPISHSPNAELERRGEVEHPQGLPALAPIGSPFNLHTKRHGNHDGNEVNLERRGRPPPSGSASFRSEPLNDMQSVDSKNKQKQTPSPKPPPLKPYHSPYSPLSGTSPFSPTSRLSVTNPNPSIHSASSNSSQKPGIISRVWNSFKGAVKKVVGLH